MGKFLSMQETADRLIAQSGGPMPLWREGTNVLDPVTQARSTSSQSHTFQAVAMAPSMAQRFGVDLSGKEAKELYIALGGAPFVPRVGDVVTLAGEAWKIFWAQTHDPALDGAIMTVAYAERGQ